MKFCTAPCIGNVTREQYLQQVLAACDFLSGQCEELKQQLEAEMKKAAGTQDYEKAASIRDALADLRRTTQKTSKFERLPYSLPLAIDPRKDLAELAKALGLPSPPQRIEGFDISNISGTFAVASLVSFKNGRPDRANYRRFKMKTVVGQDDFACMAETVRRRYTRLLREREGRDEEKEKRGKGEKEQAKSGGALSPTHEPAKTTLSVIHPSAPLPDLILIDGGKRPAQRGMRGTGETRIGAHSRHRFGEGVRGNLSARRKRAAAVEPRIPAR